MNTSQYIKVTLSPEYKISAVSHLNNYFKPYCTF